MATETFSLVDSVAFLYEASPRSDIGGVTIFLFCGAERGRPRLDAWYSGGRRESVKGQAIEAWLIAGSARGVVERLVTAETVDTGVRLAGEELRGRARRV